MLVTMKQLQSNGAKVDWNTMNRLCPTHSYAVEGKALKSLFCTDALRMYAMNKLNNIDPRMPKGIIESYKNKMISIIGAIDEIEGNNNGVA